MTNTVLITLDRVRERQFRLCVGDFNYGEFMSLLRARQLAEMIYSILLDLQESGIVSEDTRISYKDNTID